MRGSLIPSELRVYGYFAYAGGPVCKGRRIRLPGRPRTNIVPLFRLSLENQLFPPLLCLTLTKHHVEWIEGHYVMSTKSDRSTGTLNAYRVVDLRSLGLEVWRPAPVSEGSYRPLLRRNRIMLVLSRKKNESIVINDDITIVVVEIRGDKVRLGIEAPKEVPVHRNEVYEAIRRNTQEDVGQSAEPDASSAAE